MDLGLKDKLIVIAGGRGELGLAETTRIILEEREGAETIILDDGSARSLRKTDMRVNLGDPRAVKAAFRRLRRAYSSIHGYVSMVAGPLESVLPGFRTVTLQHLQIQDQQTNYAVVFAAQEVREWAEELEDPPTFIVWSSVNGLERYALNEFAYDGAQAAAMKAVGNIAISSRGKMYVIGVACGTLNNPLWEQSGQSAALSLIKRAIPDGKVTTLEEAVGHIGFYLSHYGQCLNGEIIPLARAWGKEPRDWKPDRKN